MTDKRKDETWVTIKDIVWQNDKPWIVSKIEYSPAAWMPEWRDTDGVDIICKTWSACFPAAVEHKRPDASPPVPDDVVAAIDKVRRGMVVRASYGNVACEETCDAMETITRAASQSMQGDAVAAIEFAIEIDDHYDRLEFLIGWQHGDVSAWPEFDKFKKD